MSYRKRGGSRRSFHKGRSGRRSTKKVSFYKVARGGTRM